MNRTVARFAADRRGNFAIMSGMLAVPLVLGVGLLLDLSAINRKQASLQQAIDAAVLAVAREGKSLSDVKAKEIAETFLAGNFADPVKNLQVARAGTEFTVSGQTSAGISFGPLFGYDDVPVTAEAKADIAYTTYEMALVLDTTGSMAGGKLVSMKNAVLGLVDTMPAQVADPERMKFAMVPFAGFVNVGPQFGPQFDKKNKQIDGTGAPWLDLKGESNIKQVELAKGASRFQVYANLGQRWPGCVETREGGASDYDTSDAPANPSNASTLFVPSFGIDEPDSGGYANSYITSSVNPLDVTVAAKKRKLAKYGVASDGAGNPLFNGLLSAVDALGNVLLGFLGAPSTIAIDSGTSKLFGKPKGPGLGCEMQPITALTNDYDAIKAKVNALEASGYTNILEGVAWGTRVLSPGEPFAEGKAKGPNVEKIMVILTDGSNTFGNQLNDLGSSYSSFGYLVDGRLGIAAGGASATNTRMNAKTLAACEHAKADGIEIYTIRLEEPNVATGTMLKECASSPDHYFDVPSRQQLDEAFSKIGERIVRVRIAS